MKKVNGRSIYKKVRKEGGSVVLAVTGLLPPDWRVVTIRKEPSAIPKTVILWIEKVA